METSRKAKQIISVSLGSSKRDASATLNLGGQEVNIARVGTDGSLEKARKLLEYWDGRADAIGLGGTDLYVYAGGRRYTFRESASLVANVRHTPVLDGSGLKNSLERRLIGKLASEGTIPLKGKKVLLMCAVDRFGMAEALTEAGALVTCGDLIFCLNINIPLHSLKSLARWAVVLAPVVTKLPIRWLYPVGREQEKKEVRHPEYFLENDIIAGDFHFIKKFMPKRLPGKTIITNTVTSADRIMLRKAGVETLITTTPCISGRSFGTNVMEALLVAMENKSGPLEASEYLRLLDQYKIESSVEHLGSKE